MELKRTPLYEIHRDLGARLVDFAGWEMPVQYTGLMEEHRMVRSSAGLFDVSHMGEVEITGPGARDAVQHLFTNDVDKVKSGQCQYTLLCYPTGGVVDDCIVYRFSDERFLVCVNASNTEKAFRWMKENAPKGAAVTDVSSGYAQLAVQGPNAEHFIEHMVNIDLTELKPFHFAVTGVLGFEAIVSRTGYTGEDGFEIYLDPEGAPKVWQAMLAPDTSFGIAPAGLGARDTLRLEMGYPLYGHELDGSTTPVEAGLHKRFVSLDKDFIGADVLRRQAAEGVGKTLVGFELTGAGVPRAGYKVRGGGRSVGTVTSGTHSPSLGKPIGMAYVDPELARPGTEIEVAIRNRNVSAVVVRTPFYKRKKTGAGEDKDLSGVKLYRSGLSGHGPS